MEYRVFQYGADDIYIKDIIEGFSVRNNEVVDKVWFSQRFEQNPLGKAILVCAFDRDRMISCVGVERLPFQCEGKTLVGGNMRVLFVQDGQGSKDMWYSLLKVIEEECSRQGIDLVIGFNDQNLISSAQGFEWTYRVGMVRYRFNSVTGMWRNIFKMLDMKKPFVAETKDKQSEYVQKEMKDNTCMPDYFKWLICTSIKRFVVVDNEEVCAVMITGHRGKRVREAQVCYFEPRKGVEVAQRSLVKYIKGHFTKDEVDMISCIDGKNYLSKKNLFSTSQEENYWYKWLREPIDVEIGEITQLGVFLS